MRIAALCVVFFLAIQSASAGATDSLFVRPVRGGWEWAHRCKTGETLGDISVMYGVSGSLIATINYLIDDPATVVYGTVQIPVVPAQVVIDSFQSELNAKPLYYRVQPADRLQDLCRLSGASPAALLSWNSGQTELLPGRVMILGWLRLPFRPISKEEELYTSMRELWEDQTVGGKNVITEKGSAAFYTLTVHNAEAAWYAFHNVAAKGTVMKVRNLNNGKMIYVKIIGPLPDGKQFYGCSLGLSDVAKQELGARENKVFCEMSYGGY